MNTNKNKGFNKNTFKRKVLRSPSTTVGFGRVNVNNTSNFSETMSSNTWVRFNSTNTNLDESWEKLEQLCVHSPETFINLTSCFDVQTLNYAKKLSKTESINLFGVAIREKSSILVRHMLSCNLFTDKTLNDQVFNQNPFAYACSLDVEIAFQMLNSSRIRLSLINDTDGFHPFKILVGTKCSLPEYSDNIKNLELAMSSNKFLKDCTTSQMTKAFYGFLTSVRNPQIISIVLSNNKLTSAMIENMYFYHGAGSIIEDYCVNASPETLSILLDSDKITSRFIISILPNLTYDSYREEIQDVLDTHVKFTDSEGMSIFKPPYRKFKKSRVI